MLNVVLVAPEIPANTGNIGRTCVVTGSRLHLIEPLGFSLDDHSLHRAGLGYWKSLDVTTYPSWDSFIERNGLSGEKGEGRLHLLTKKARRIYADARYSDGDFLVFGCESRGLPEELLAAHAERCERIPMLPDAASLTDADEWAAGQPARSHKALLQRDVCGNFVNPDDWRVSALNLSNAAAIVLYEALRQTGFPGM
ncbi:MAG: tRNA (cytidine(34)-2'-O)-methyltransferase [Tractidigestivibacter sp.]|uniref:tRNA (cytidine(34)-2'-O)-methyltransferase n=1 Tax=Tractidigestivibacter sp. TaxID=2847320 RepID=UPI003D8C0A42